MQEDNPWTTISSEKVYENNWIKVIENQVINPSGGRGIYGQVDFKNVAIGIVPLDENLNTWLVGQYRYPLKEYSWEIPEGGCPEGEDWEKTAKRELKEETGLIAEKLTNISKIHTSNSVCSEVGYVFLAENLTQKNAEPEDTEDLKVKKVTLKEAIEMVMNNQITDSISCIALLKVGILKGIL